MGSRNARDDGGLEELERQFDAAMLEIYERAGHEVGYWATGYPQMLRARGGLATARRLLRGRDDPPDASGRTVPRRPGPGGMPERAVQLVIEQAELLAGTA